MPETDLILMVIGSVLLLGLATEYIGRVSALPRVTLLMLFGVVIGHDGLGILPHSSAGWFPLVTNMALLLVGFLLGGKISIRELGKNGPAILYISLSVVLVTVCVVAGGFLLAGFSLATALLFAGIATATDPAATLDVVRENGSQGNFTDTMLGIVAIDDAWGLIVFSIILALAQLFQGAGVPADVLLNGSRELAGAVVLGLVLGIPSALLTGRLKPGEPTLVEALGVVFLCGGLAGHFEVSFLLTAMVLGATVSNLATHHDQPFHAIEDIEWPFMILFFVFTGASLNFEHLSAVVPLALLYIVLRCLGRWLGAWPGARIAGTDQRYGRWMGLSLLPQAGVANGMALLASSAIPELRPVLLPVAIVATVFFELVGPLATRWTLKRVGDIQ
ncbi:MAG: cation:proton antiporter [Granulosicoccus sp.]|nr:cation:proton antiporter [Granulosicoccus sp.]